MSDITLHDERNAAGRETGLRTFLYPKWVESGRMSQEEADHELACMQAIYKRLDGLYKAEQEGLRLFPDKGDV